MDPDPLSISVLVAASLIVVFSAVVELAIANVNRSDIRARASAGDQRAARIDRLLDDAAQVLTTFMMLKTVGYMTAGAAAIWLWLPSTSIGLLLALFVGLWLSLAVLQIFIRAAVLPHTVATVLRLSWTITGLTRSLRPVSSLLNAFARFAGDDEPVTEESIFLTDDGLRLLMHVREQEDQLQDSEREMMASILELEETIAREAMVPRIDMVALEVETDFATALAVINEAGHSRIPVYEGNIDRILGFLYAKDLLRCYQEGTTDQPIRALLRPAYFVPVTKKLNALFSEMQKQRSHVALVVDEYGGTAGLITIEDILEEIVGDIQDEYDADEDEYVQPLAGHGYLLNARIDVDTLAALLDIELPDENADTLGGMLYGLLGRVPQQGESVTYDGWRFSVVLLDGRRIEQVRVEPVEPVDFEDEDVELSKQPSGQRSLPRFLSL